MKTKRGTRLQVLETGRSNAFSVLARTCWRTARDPKCAVAARAVLEQRSLHLLGSGPGKGRASERGARRGRKPNARCKRSDFKLNAGAPAPGTIFLCSAPRGPSGPPGRHGVAAGARGVRGARARVPAPRTRARRRRGRLRGALWQVQRCCGSVGASRGQDARPRAMLPSSECHRRHPCRRCLCCEAT